MAVEQLKRNEFGQLSDSRVKEIESDIESAMKSVFDKWSNVTPYDIEFIVHRKVAHVASMRTAKLNSKQGKQSTPAFKQEEKRGADGKREVERKNS